MNSFLKSALVAAVVASLSGAACADAFSLSGTFGSDPYYGFYGPLKGGSFSGTYDFDGSSFTSFDIFLRDANGMVLAEINSAVNGTYADLIVSPDDATLVNIGFYSDASKTASLNLNFKMPYSGAGTVELGSGQSFSFANVGGFRVSQVTAVAGGVAVAVPEPATWGLMGLGLVGVGAITRRRKAA